MKPIIFCEQRFLNDNRSIVKMTIFQSRRDSSSDCDKLIAFQFWAGDVILDLGCCTGELSAYLAEPVGPEGKVIGVDPDKERIEMARQSHSASFRGKGSNASTLQYSLMLPETKSNRYKIRRTISCK